MKLTFEQRLEKSKEARERDQHMQRPRGRNMPSIFKECKEGSGARMKCARRQVERERVKKVDNEPAYISKGL